MLCVSMLVLCISLFKKRASPSPTGGTLMKPRPTERVTTSNYKKNTVAKKRRNADTARAGTSEVSSHHVQYSVFVNAAGSRPHHVIVGTKVTTDGQSARDAILKSTTYLLPPHLKKTADNTNFILNDSGHVNEEIWPNVVEGFLKHLGASPAKPSVKPHLLMMDNHNSHKNFEYIARLLLSNVWVAFMPPKTTALMQPLDAVVFKVVKGEFRKQLEKHVKLSKFVNFRAVMRRGRAVAAIAYLEAAQAKLTRKLMRTAWKKCGYLPLQGTPLTCLPASVAARVTAEEKSGEGISWVPVGCWQLL